MDPDIQHRQPAEVFYAAARPRGAANPELGQGDTQPETSAFRHRWGEGEMAREPRHHHMVSPCFQSIRQSALSSARVLIRASGAAGLRRSGPRITPPARECPLDW
jgi:hypothetical protein